MLCSTLLRDEETFDSIPRSYLRHKKGPDLNRPPPPHPPPPPPSQSTIYSYAPADE